MSTTLETPQWVLELQKNINNLLSEEYKSLAHYQYTNQTLILEFPTKLDNNLNMSAGLTHALNKFNGTMYQNKTTQRTNLEFPNPQTTTAAADNVSPFKHVTAKMVIQNEQVPTNYNNSSYQAQQNSGNTNSPQQRGEKNIMNMNDYLKSNGNWISTKNCKIGDVFKIKEPPYFEETTYEDKTSIQCVVKVTKEADNQEMNMRLNKSNAQILADNYGTDVTTWTGKRVRIITTKTYNNKTGFIYAPT
ncbi:MAG: hypothetical protein LBE70_03070 [Nitrososphaerota archaeon]|jgi:hypothetical protein|nr:hypothetical protein [Nitrososphaerota archaeon]